MTREEKISRLKDILSEINENDNAVCYLTSEDNELIESAIEALEQESQTFEWCTGCREYDQEKHCCHRWSKVIRSAVEEIKQESCEDAISREDALMCMTGEYIADMTYKPEDIISKHIQRLRALPSVQPKPIECEDAISREEAIGAVANLFEMSEYPHPYSQGKPIRLREIKEKLKQLPSVQPKIKTGHWIDDEFGSKCSCCGIHTHLDKFDKPMKFKYCSMCGAKMVKSNMLEIPTGSESEDKE